MKKYMIMVVAALVASVSFGGPVSPETSYAHSFDGEYRYQRDYYPLYRPFHYQKYRHYNPVEKKEYHRHEGYAPNGTYHREDAVVDKHSSYYSRGRNHAITRPQTTVKTWSSGPSQQTTREKTTWIGADGRPHSTTITSDTTVDRWGNTRTDTHVQLRKVMP